MHYTTEKDPGERRDYTYYKLIVEEKMEFCFSNCVDWYFVDIQTTSRDELVN